MNSEIGRIQNAPERHIYGRMRQNAGRGRYLAISFLALGVILALAFCRTGAPAYAQIVTPYPGVSATATAAAQQMNAAQGQRDSASQRAAQQAQQAAQYAAAAQQAAQQAQQAAQAKAAADAAFNAAAQAAADARAALVAQQVGAASEALGRSEELISSGKSQLINISSIVEVQSKTIVSLTAQLQKAQTDLQQERTAKQTAINVNQALQARLIEAESRFTINPTIAILAAAFLIVLVVGFVAWKWSRNNHDRHDDPPDEQPIAAGYTINQDEIIDQDQERMP